MCVCVSVYVCSHTHDTLTLGREHQTIYTHGHAHTYTHARAHTHIHAGYAIPAVHCVTSSSINVCSHTTYTHAQTHTPTYPHRVRHPGGKLRDFVLNQRLLGGGAKE